MPKAIHRPFRRRRTATPLALLVALLALVLDARAGPPRVPLKAFIPEGWRLLQRFDTDLDGDDRADAALVLARIDDAFTRRLVVVMVGERSQRLVGQLSLTDAMEPPQLEARRGVLIVRSSTGGATTVVDVVQRFRLEPASDRMRLIGLDVSRYSRTQQADQQELSFNTLTGERILTTSRVIDRRADGSEIPWEERSYDAPQARTLRVSPPQWYMENAPAPDEVLEAALAGTATP